MIDAETLFRTARSVYAERSSLLFAGNIRSDLHQADYLTILDRLRLGYSDAEIMNSMFRLYGVADLDYVRLKPARQAASVVLLTDLVLPQAYPLSEAAPYLALIRAAMKKAPKRYALTLKEFHAIDRAFHQSVEKLETFTHM